MEFEPLSRLLIGAAIDVHRELGPGLLESAYQRCLEYELRRLGLRVETQVPISLTFRALEIRAAYRADLIVENSIIVEVKCVAKLEPIHRAQVVTYLRLTGLQLGLILNFNVPALRDGIARVVR